MRQSQAPIVLPPSLVHLLARRDDAVHKGLYAEAAQVQAELEGLKASTEDALAQTLAERHAGELSALEAACRHEYEALAARWDADLRRLKSSLQASEQELLARHVADMDALHQRFASEGIRHHVSKQLLELRCREANLRRLCNFAKADEVQQLADALEGHEVAGAAAQQVARQQAEQSKLLARQERELAAQRRKAHTALSEAVLAQERELERGVKKLQAARLALTRTHGQERLALEQALRSWCNVRKLPPPSSGAGSSRGGAADETWVRWRGTPSTAQSTASGETGGGGLLLAAPHEAQDAAARPKRPETAPGKLVHRPPSTAASTTPPGSSLPEDADQWPDSPIDGQLAPRAPKPWDNGSSSHASSNSPPRPRAARPRPGPHGLALQPKHNGTAVGILSLQRPGTAGPAGLAYVAAPSQRPATVSGPSPAARRPAQLLSLRIPAKDGSSTRSGSQASGRPPPAADVQAGPGQLSHARLRAHTKVVNGSAASVLGGKASHASASFTSGGAFVQSSNAPSSPGSPGPRAGRHQQQYLVLHS